MASMSFEITRITIRAFLEISEFPLMPHISIYGDQGIELIVG